MDKIRASVNPGASHYTQVSPKYMKYLIITICVTKSRVKIWKVGVLGLNVAMCADDVLIWLK